MKEKFLSENSLALLDKVLSDDLALRSAELNNISFQLERLDAFLSRMLDVEMNFKDINKNGVEQSRLERGIGEQLAEGVVDLFKKYKNLIERNSFNIKELENQLNIKPKK